MNGSITVSIIPLDVMCRIEIWLWKASLFCLFSLSP